MNVAEELWGPPFIGVILCMRWITAFKFYTAGWRGYSFYGVTVAQAIFYYVSFPRDPLYLKCLVSRPTLPILCNDPLISLSDRISLVRRVAWRKIHGFWPLFRSVMDTLHVYCLCSGFWRFLILARIDVNLLVVTPWYVFSYMAAF